MDRVTEVQVKSHVSITGVKEPMKRSHNNNEFCSELSCVMKVFCSAFC